MKQIEGFVVEQWWVEAMMRDTEAGIVE